MSFEQTLGLTIVGLIIAGLGYLARFHPKECRFLGNVAFAATFALFVILFTFWMGYTTGASDQWFAAFHSLNATDRLKLSEPGIEVARVGTSPIPGWVWEELVFLGLAEAVLLTVLPLLGGSSHAEADVADTDKN